MEEKIKKVRELLSRFGGDALLISSVPNISYLTEYFNFSIEEKEAYLLICKTQQYIFTDTRYSEAIERRVKNFKLIPRSPSLPFKDALKEVIRKERISKLGFEEDNLTFKEYKVLTEIINNLLPVTLENLRIQKTKREIEKIKKACEIADLVFEKIIKEIKSGVSEKEIGNKIELFAKEDGGEASFKPIVAFGENSSVPHHETANSRLEKKLGQFIKIDFGVKYEGYCSDMTRTLFFGKPTKKQRLIYKTVLEAQERASGFIRKQLERVGPLTQKSKLKGSDPIRAKEVDKVAREYIKQIGFYSIPHSLGHGIGIEVHEPPRLSPKSDEHIEEGMVFSIEPGIYIPGYGGVRIEDLFAIQNGKLVKLTESSKVLQEL